MKDLRFHAILFGLAVVGALLTWTREVSYNEDENIVRIWDRDSADVQLVHYQTGETDLRIERRTDQAGDFYWGTQVGGTDGPDTLSFPVGATGLALVSRIARLRTLREMGTLAPGQMEELGFEGSTRRLEVRFPDEQRQLILGNPVFGVPDEYAFEPATGLGYVLSRDIVQPLANGEGHVRERWLHRFEDADVAEVRVEMAGRVRAMSPGQLAGEWTEVGGGAPDLAFGTFMQRVGELAIDGFRTRPDPASVQLLLRAEYFGAEGESLGFLELMRDDSAPDAYFLVTETTRVPAQAMGFLARRAEEGLSGVFSGAARGGLPAAQSGSDE